MLKKNVCSCNAFLKSHDIVIIIMVVTTIIVIMIITEMKNKTKAEKCHSAA